MTNRDYRIETAEAFVQAKNWSALLEYVKPFAEAGVSDAECELGTMYLVGLGVPADFQVAEYWLTKAAEQDNPVAWNNLGTLYAQLDPERSKQCYRRAVQLGFLSSAPLAQ